MRYPRYIMRLINVGRRVLVCILTQLLYFSNNELLNFYGL